MQTEIANQQAPKGCLFHFKNVKSILYIYHTSSVFQNIKIVILKNHIYEQNTDFN